MSYQVIARKWRPQTFEEVTGQEIITRTLRNAIEHDRLHHAYLFSGARGVGKTTTARILAKSLNCHKTDGPNLTPCLLTDPDICPSCLEISESRSMDVLEIDAASHTGIDSVRETIIENIGFNPARDRYKVFIIDEVHQLSKPAFNALLKTLEEPPGNVVFVMATTELHKVPDTILSRCQEFQFRTIPLQKIFDRLKLIADAENIVISLDALREIARSGEGSMRDAQSNFDQVISFSADEITPADVTSALGFAGLPVLTQTLTAIAERRPKDALAVVDGLVSGGNDLRNFCRDVLGLFRDLLVLKVAEGEDHLFEGAAFGRAELSAMASQFTEADLVRFFNSLAETETKLRDAVHPRYVLEIGLVKLIEMRSVTSIESILERLDALSSGQPLPEMTTAERPISAPKADTLEKKTLKTGLAMAPAVAERPSGKSQTVGENLSQGANSEKPSNFAGLDISPDEPADVFGPDVFAGFDQLLEPSDANLASDQIVEDEPKASRGKEAFVFMPPTPRLPRLTSEELEHYEDTRLDDAYDERLLLTGDDLLPISSADTLIKMLFGDSEAAQPIRASAGSPTTTSAAAKPAFDVAQLRAELALDEVDVPLPTLGSEPTPDELQQYAKAHPAVRSVMRVFRAKVVDVSIE
jgi:DNA polymerase III subunit gamma/tau